MKYKTRDVLKYIWVSGLIIAEYLIRFGFWKIKRMNLKQMLYLSHQHLVSIIPSKLGHTLLSAEDYCEKNIYVLNNLHNCSLNLI